MRSRKRSILIYLMCLITTLMLMLGMVGCVNAPSNPLSTENIDISTEDEEVVITFSNDEYAYSMFKPLMETFHEENPSITVQYVPLTAEDYNTPKTVEDRLLMLAESADTTLTNIRTAEMGGYFLDLQPLIDADSTFDQADFQPETLSAMEDTQGRVLGLPMTLFMRGIFYDKAAFDAANLSYPQPGWTWDDFHRAIAVLTQNQAGEARFGYADRSSASILQPLIGHSLEINDGEINAEILADELDWYVQMAWEEQLLGLKSTDDYWNGLLRYGTPPVMWYGSLYEFALGLGMGEPDVINLVDLFTESAYGFAPFPIDADGENVNTTPVSALSGVISAGSEHPAESWQWLKYLSEHWLVSDTSYVSDQLNIPARQSVAAENDFWVNYPTEVQEAMQYGLEHAWFSSLYTKAESAVMGAVRDTTEGRATDLQSALEEAETEQASWVQDVMDYPEIIVATPQPTEDPSLGAVKINFYYEGWTAGEKTAIKLLVYDFNQEYMGKIIVEASNSQRESGSWGFFETMSTDYDCYLSQVMTEYAAQSDDVLDLTAFLEAEDSTFQQDFNQSLLNASRYKEVLYSLPLSIQPGLIVYNADLLAEHGLESPSIDWTFDEFIELITAVTSTSGTEQTAGLLHSSNSVSFFKMFLAGRNTQWRDTSGEYPVITINTPEMADTLLWFNELDGSGVFFKGSSDEDWWSSISSAVNSGEVGFWSTRAGEEEREFFYSKPSFEVGIAPLPSTPLPNGPYEFSYVLGFYISSETENPQACWELAKYLSEHTEVLNGVPSRISIANSPAWEAQVGVEKAEIYRIAAESQLAEIEEDSINSYFWVPISGWIAHANANIGNGNNPEQELALAQQYADAYLECMALVDISDLTIEELYAAVRVCEVQVDPSYYD